MPLKVAAFYQFAALPDFRELREPLRAFAAGPHHIDSGKRGRRMRRRYHGVMGMDRRAAGKMEIPHRESFFQRFL